MTCIFYGYVASLQWAFFRSRPKSCGFRRGSKSKRHQKYDDDGPIKGPWYNIVFATNFKTGVAFKKASILIKDKGVFDDITDITKIWWKFQLLNAHVGSYFMPLRQL